MPLLAILCLFLNEESARADLKLTLTNGPTVWTTPDSPNPINPIYGDPGTVSLTGDQATIHESGGTSFSDQETDMYTIFTIPIGAKSLNFTIVSTSADPTAVANDIAPAAFGASLIDPNSSDPNYLQPLVPTAYPYPQTDSYYTGDITGVGTGASGLTNVATGSSVTIPSPSVVSVDVSGLQGQSAELLFRVISAMPDDSSATVTLSGVQVVTASGVLVVPEPSTLPLVILGDLGMVAHCRRRRLIASNRPGTVTQRP